MVAARSSMRRFRSSITFCMRPVASTRMTTSSPTLRRPPTYLPKEVPSDQPAPPPPPPTPKPPTPAPADAKREPRSTPAPTGRAGGAKCTVGEVGRGTAGDGTTIAWAVAGLSSSFSACSAFGSFGGTGVGRSSSEKISRRRCGPRPMPPPDPTPKPGPMPRPKPPPAPRMSKKTMRPRSTCAAVEIPRAASRRRGRGPVVVSSEVSVGPMAAPQSEKLSRRAPATPSPPEPRAQRPRLRAAERDLAARRIAHDELVAAAEPGDDLLHVLQVHEVRLVGAEEERRVEALLEVAQRVVGHEGALGGVRIDQAVLEPQPEHVGDP